MNTFFNLIYLSLLHFAGNGNLKAMDHHRQDDQPIIVDNYTSIQSIEQLTYLFKGKPFYVDLWATWCEPCHEEFKYSSEVYGHLKKAGVQVVYISIDGDAQDSLWRADVFKYKLSGYHIRAAKSLQNSLTTLIWSAKMFIQFLITYCSTKTDKSLIRRLPNPIQERSCLM
jgi:thiol-disulfide isomerase/thioredoxin